MLLLGPVLGIFQNVALCLYSISPACPSCMRGLSCSRFVSLVRILPASSYFGRSFLVILVHMFTASVAPAEESGAVGS